MLLWGIDESSEEGRFPYKRPHPTGAVVETGFGFSVDNPHETQMIVYAGVSPTIPFGNGFGYTVAGQTRQARFIDTSIVVEVHGRISEVVAHKMKAVEV